MTITPTEITYRESGIFDNLFLDYVEGNPKTKPFYAFTPDAAGIEKMLSESDFSTVDRNLLVDELKRQYQGLETNVLTEKNIGTLTARNTFTITTGHQLCLFTGPLYFIYKIISTINWCEELNKKIPGKHFVPVYWMAGEDHDIEEINHVNVYGKKLVW